MCAACGGKCEYSKIGTLLPGEKRFMARQAGLGLSEFQDRYLDVLVVDGVDLDVLKFVEPCPFLGPDFACNCRSFKVIMCEVYPIVFSVQGSAVSYSLDPDCPLARDPKAARHFTEVGIPALRSLSIPIEWFRLVEQYDHLLFDYKRIQATRKSRRCERFELGELKKFASTQAKDALRMTHKAQGDAGRTQHSGRIEGVERDA